MTGSIIKDLLINQRGTLGNSTKKCSIKETISENLCFQVIILGFLNVRSEEHTSELQSQR